MASTTLSNKRSTGPTKANAKSGKRRDIQGLRAVAVLLVVLDHLFQWPSGGFIGVDVFFVISGFLITGLLLREYDRTGTLSFAGFYKRRIRRIIPAAVTVLIVTVGVAFLLFNAARATETLNDAIWGLFFSANWHFASVGTDYFQADGPVSVLQHFWSLAVEEQFYFVWPWLMLLVFWIGGRSASWSQARAHRAVGAVMAVIVAVSFCWSLYQTASSPTVSYFSTLSRAWELGAGALVAVLVPMLVRLPSWLRPFLAWAGTCGIVGSALSITSGMPFPAPWAAVPVMSTVLVIAAGTGGTQSYLWPLTNRVAGYFGDISYSLYLWHFPVIVMTRLFFPDIDLAYYATAVGGMLFLAIASFHLIEEPVRRSEWLLPKTGGGQGIWGTFGAPSKFGALAVLAVVTALISTMAVMRTEPVGQTVVAPVGAPLAQAGVGEAKPVDSSPLGVLKQQITMSLASSSFPEFKPAVETLGIEAWSRRPEIACMNVYPSNLHSCLTGPANATKTVAVIGDSFAVAWLPGLRAALEPLGYKVQALTLGQCPAASVSVTNEGGEAFPECASHLAWSIDMVSRINPELTILASAQDSTTRRLVSGKKGNEAAAEIADGLAETITQIGNRSGRVAVLSAPPGGKILQECVTRVSNPSSCISQITPDSRLLVAAEKKIAERLSVTYVDTSLWFCNVDGYCPGFVGATPVRTDSAHMTVEYSQKLAPVIAETLR